MKRVISLITFAGLITAASAGFCKDGRVLTDEGYGVVRFGSTLQEVEKKLNEKGKRQAGEQSCDFVSFRKYPGIMFMVEEGVVTRADTVSASIPNSLDIRIGTSLSVVKRRYPHAVIQPHKYDERGHYVIFKSANRKRAIVFEEGDGKITSVRAGLEPSVEYVEGCL